VGQKNIYIGFLFYFSSENSTHFSFSVLNFPKKLYQEFGEKQKLKKKLKKTPWTPLC